MKKNKLSVSLVASLIAAVGMSSCSSVKSSKESILSFKGYDGTNYNIITDEMYAEYQTTENITKFYNPILEVLIRNEFANENSPLAVKKSYATIKQEAENDVKDKKEEAENSSESYNTAWENILDSYNVESEDELLEHFIFEHEKEAAEDWYYETYKEALTKEYIGITKDGSAYTVGADSGYPYRGQISSKLPYHIRHILVNTSGSGTEYGVDTISQDNAKKLYNVVDELRDGNKTFGQIAQSRSDDSGSAAEYGDVGIMDNNASSDGSLTMVSEFQLGIYAYDVLLGSNKTKNNTAVKNGLGINAEVENKIKSTAYALKDNSGDFGVAGLTRVPVSVFDALKEYAETEEAADGYNLANGKEQIYPRNILWNKYLNHHNPFIITNNEAVIDANAYTKDSTVTAADLANEHYNDNVKAAKVDTTSAVGKCGFRKASELGLADEEHDFGVLCDEQGNVIIGVRSTYGIHFMIVQKSILDFNDGAGDNVSLEQYYTTLVPSDSNFPKDSKGNNKSTYVTYIASTDASVYKTRADKLKDKIKSYDSTYEYRLFEKLYDMNKANFNLSGTTGETLIANILNYVEIQRENRNYDQETGLALAWDKYFEMIELQNETREYNKKDKDENVMKNRVIPEGCIIGFKKKYADIKNNEQLKKLYEEGGPCYYGK